MQLYHYQFFIAFALAIASTFCTVTGVSQIFEANALAIAIITTLLESGKYGTMFALTKRWNDIYYKNFRYILVPLICCMTILSSAGIFSFYATSYVRSTKPIASYSLELETLDSKIQQSNSLIERAKQQQDQINKAIGRYVELDRLKQSQQLRQQNQEELTRLDDVINSELDNIKEYNERKLSITQEVSKIKQESGFITNIASTLHIDLTKDADGEFKVVLIIIAIVLLALEPLSLFSMVLGQIEYKRVKGDTNLKSKEIVKDEKPITFEKPSFTFNTPTNKNWNYKFTPSDIVNYIYGKKELEDTVESDKDDTVLEESEVFTPDLSPEVLANYDLQSESVDVDSEIDKERPSKTVEVQ